MAQNTTGDLPRPKTVRASLSVSDSLAHVSCLILFARMLPQPTRDRSSAHGSGSIVMMSGLPSVKKAPVFPTASRGKMPLCLRHHPTLCSQFFDSRQQSPREIKMLERRGVLDECAARRLCILAAVSSGFSSMPKSLQRTNFRLSREDFDFY